MELFYDYICIKNVFEWFAFIFISWDIVEVGDSLSEISLEFYGSRIISELKSDSRGEVSLWISIFVETQSYSYPL